MSFVDVTDSELIYLLRANNKEAENYFFERYKKRIYGIINSMASKFMISDLDYEDCFQDCFIVFLKCLDMFDDDYNFYNYLFGAITKDFGRKLQKDRKEKQLLSLENGCFKDDNLIDMVCEEDASYKRTLLDEYICLNFSILEQDIIRYKMMGYDCLEIAKIIGITPKTVYKKVALIKKKILDNGI